MFATIRRYQGQPGHTEEVLRRVQLGLIPMLTIQRGFVSYYAIDAGDDVALSVSIYADRASAEAANQSVTSWVRMNLGDLVGPADVTLGEVRLSATSAPA